MITRVTWDLKYKKKCETRAVKECDVLRHLEKGNFSHFSVSENFLSVDDVAILWFMDDKSYRKN